MQDAGDAEPTPWEAYNRRWVGAPPRELLHRALGLCALAGPTDGTAVDLGAGAGVATLELLRRGYTVHAVDSDEPSLRILAGQVPAGQQARVHRHHLPFQDFIFPPCDVVWAGNSLPFCPPQALPALCQRIAAALRPGGRFAADFFGPRHTFARHPEVMLIDEPALRHHLRGLEIEAFNIEDSLCARQGEVIRWHAFGVIARKAVP